MQGIVAMHRRTSRPGGSCEVGTDFGDDAAGRNLRVTLTYLQRVLEPGRPGSAPPYFLRADGPALDLSVGPWLTIDVHDFDRCLDDAEEADGHACTSRALPAYQHALALYRGDFCSGQPDADW